MRFLLPLCLLIAPAVVHAQPVSATAPRGLFMSPMGEPFRSADPAADNVAAWFAGADREPDGALTAAELRRDATRFFAALDGDGNGELSMAEIARYENEVAPEVQVGLQMRSTGVGDWQGGRRRRAMLFDRGVDGAGRFSFLNIPHPVMAADSDLNRGVTRSEFEGAAGERFALLDKDRDGRLTRAELPPLPQPRLRRQRGEVPPPRPLESQR
jgi:Ca2+-binding EF-hand superfamily protein